MFGILVGFMVLSALASQANSQSQGTKQSCERFFNRKLPHKTFLVLQILKVILDTKIDQ